MSSLAPAAGHGTTTRIFHWLVAALVILMVPAGIAMTSEGFASVTDELFIFHKGTGAILLVIVVARVAWRLFHRPPPLPETVPAGERRLAGAAHLMLYGLLLVQVVSGYVRTVGGNYPIELLNVLGVPPLLPEMPVLAETMAVVHKFCSYALVALISAHVAAAVRHALVLRDGVWHRMWPPLGRGADGGDP
jgi:cytochrome b561